MKRAFAFTFLGLPWSLMLYETSHPRDEATTQRAAAYCLDDPKPRGPRRCWTVLGGSLVPWEPRYEGDWPALDEVATTTMKGAAA